MDKHGVTKIEDLLESNWRRNQVFVTNHLDAKEINDIF